MSEAGLKEVAEQIEPYAEAIIDANGQLTREDITKLAKQHATRHISSERSCRIVDEYITGERV